MASTDAVYRVSFKELKVEKLGADEPPMFFMENGGWNGPYSMTVAIQDLLVDLLQSTVEMGYQGVELISTPEEAAKIKEAVGKAKGRKRS